MDWWKLTALMAAACLSIAGAFALACDDDDDDDNDADDDDDDDDDDTADDDTGDDDDDTAPTIFDCAAAGYPVREFADAQDDAALYATAADFTVATTAGAWHLKANWTGCETYLFIQDNARQNAGWPVDLWERDVGAFLFKLPDNAQVFYLSTEDSQEDRNAALALVRAQVDDFLADLSADERAAWAGRIHYVTERAPDIAGWIGDIFTSPRWGAAIDRFQRVRYIGSYADSMRYDADRGWFAPNMKMAANEPIYYNFEAERQTRLDAQSATVLTLFDGEELSDPNWSGERGYVEIELPDAATMAGFNKLELDLYLGCVGDGEYGDCPAWDYIVNLYLCDAANPDECGTEVGRWITTYHREGRWVHDVTGLLPLLADGGTRRFAFYTQQPYEVSLALRLYHEAGAPRPIGAEYLFSGGPFGPDYNESYAPIDLTVPADATRVELATVITGHGGATPGNCAEFCDTTHHFTVNGTEYVRDFPDAGDSHDCMDKVTEGTVPNQYGTWWYGRSGWCPGKDVPMETFDVTADAPAGQTATFTYEGFYNGEPYTSDGANIQMTSWVVYYAD